MSVSQNQAPGSLAPPFDTLFVNKDWEGYCSALENECLKWWFDLNFETLRNHLHPLQQAPSHVDLPERVRFLLCVTETPFQLADVTTWWEHFQSTNDFESAAAAAVAVQDAVWSSGHSLQRFELWCDRTRGLLNRATGVSFRARAALVLRRALKDMVVDGDLNTAAQDLDTGVEWAREADSPSLEIHARLLGGPVCLWSGDPSRFEVAMLCVRPFFRNNRIPRTLRVRHDLFLGLLRLMQGDFQRAGRMIGAIEQDTGFARLPITLRLLTLVHLLQLHVLTKNRSGVREYADKVLTWAVPLRNDFFQACTHLLLARTAITERRCALADSHARLAGQLAAVCGSRQLTYLVDLVTGQSLARQGSPISALRHLLPRSLHWADKGFASLSASARFEAARVLHAIGRKDHARSMVRKGEQLLPRNERLPTLLHGPEFLLRLKRDLAPDPVSARSDPLVEIRMFGPLWLRIGDQVIYDRHWRSHQSKMLLAAIVVHGGSKVPLDILLDLFWPEAEGDMGMHSCKMALSRLRKIGPGDSPAKHRWLVVRHRRVSLLQETCCVDTLLFDNALGTAMQQGDFKLLQLGLDLYQDDFLPLESLPWIVRHRETLRRKYLRGVLALSRLCRHPERSGAALPYLSRALEMEPLNEELHAALMRAYIGLGFPSNAVVVYHQATDMLRRELSTTPGPTLRRLLKQAKGS